MDKKNIIIIFLVIVIIALTALIGASFFLNNAEDDVVIYNNAINDVGTFNTTNVTNFTYSDDFSNDVQTVYVANDTRVQIIITSSSSAIEITVNEADKVNDSAKGHTIYKNTANVGEYKGEVRYFSYLKDNDNQRYIYISSPEFNLTSMMVDTFKFY